MKDSLVSLIQVQPFAGVRPNHRGHPGAVSVCGADFETVKGRPYLLGWQGDRDATVSVAPVNDKTALPALVGYALREMRRHDTPLVLVFAHVLRYDLGVALWPHLRVWCRETAREGVLTVGPARVEYFFGEVCFAKVHYRRRLAWLIDTHRFFSMSLDAAAQAIGLTVRKLPKPRGLGLRRIPLREMRPYLERDVEIVRELGRRIVAWHREYNLYPSVSVAQLSMRVFRKVYVKTRWQNPPAAIREAALLAYHGGRNGLYCAPGWRRVRLLDINSAYPWAMRQLPSFVAGAWRRVHDYAGPWGFYRLYRGQVRQGRYPILFAHDFAPLADGPLTAPVWVTGMELSAALRAGLLRNARWVGYVWEPESSERPLRAFVLEMYRRRQAARSKEARTFYKLLLNSLYGKFIAKVELLEPDAEGHRYVCGGQFYPVAGAWITALVRVKLWRMERATKALHSATDGLMVPPGLRVPTSDALGAWKDEGTGTALILRNKFYQVYGRNGKVLKCAYHGYDGNGDQLRSMLRAGRSWYTVRRLRTWLDSANAGVRPFVPEKVRFTVSCSMRGFWPPPSSCLPE